MLEEELKNSNFLDTNMTATDQVQGTTTTADDNKKEMELISSPMGSFLMNRRRAKQSQDKPVDGFYLDRPNMTVSTENSSSAVNACGIGDSPKFQPVNKRRNR